MIPFTQYLRPHGEKRAANIERSEETERLAREFLERGGRFECEQLTDLTVSLTAVHPDCKDGDCAIILTPNGPSVPEAVDELVRKAHAWKPR